MVHTVSEAHAVQRTIGDKTFFMKGNNQDLFGLWDHVAVRNKDYRFTMNKAFGPEPTDELQKVIYLNTPKWANINPIDVFPNCIFVQTKSRLQSANEKKEYDRFPYKWKFLFVWRKGKNGRYGEPYIELLK